MKKVSFLPRIIFLLLLAVYIIVLVKVILFKFSPFNGAFLLQQLTDHLQEPERMKDRLLQQGNFVAFKEIKGNLRSKSTHSLVNLFGNIAIFIPFGALLSYGLSRWRFLKVLVFSFLMSLSLEAAQVIFSMGTFDVDDLILNTSGGVLGHAVYSMYRWTVPKNKRLSALK